VVVQNDDVKVVPNAQRARLQFGARGIAILCGVTAVWDLAYHEVPHAGDLYGAPPDWSDILMLKWKDSYAGTNSSGPALLEAVAKANGVEASSFEELLTLEPHRLLLFRANGTAEEVSTLKAKWVAASTKVMAGLPGEGALAEIVDKFPGSLDYTMCAVARSQVEDDTPAHFAYVAACTWMQHKIAMSLTSAHMQKAAIMAALLQAANNTTTDTKAEGVAAKSDQPEETVEVGDDLATE